MNKDDFIDRYKTVAGCKKKDAAIAVDTLLRVISDAICDGEDIYLTPLGHFEVRHMPAKTMTYLKGNKAGQQYEKPAYTKIVFKPSKHMKNRLKGE